MNNCVNEAARHLVKLEVFFDGKNSYSFNYEGKVKVFRGDIKALAKFLQSFRAKDNKTNPRSARGERYIDIANEITDGSDRIIYAWSNDLQNAFSRHESVEEALKPTDYDVFVFSNPTTQNLFIDTVKKWQAKLTIKYNKVFVDSNTILNHMSDLANFFDKYIDDFVMYSGAEYQFLISRGVKIESASKVKESNDEIILSSDSFKKLGIYDKVVQYYNQTWADALCDFADDPECHKKAFYLMSDGNDTLYITNMNSMNFIEFFRDSSGSRPGDMIIIHSSPNIGKFSRPFAAARKIIYIGLDGDELVVTATYPGNNILTLEDTYLEGDKIKENITFIARDGSVEVSNSDKNIISDLFEALNNNAYWVCDEKNMSCLKKDGTAIRIKGNFITIENGMMNVDIPYLKDTKFIVENDGMVSIILGNSNAIRGVINL